MRSECIWIWMRVLEIRMGSIVKKVTSFVAVTDHCPSTSISTASIPSYSVDCHVISLATKNPPSPKKHPQSCHPPSASSITLFSISTCVSIILFIPGNGTQIQANPCPRLGSIRLAIHGNVQIFLKHFGIHNRTRC